MTFNFPEPDRPPVPAITIELLERILNYLNFYFDVDKALNLVDTKLRLRYPNGYSPDKSVNRAN